MQEGLTEPACITLINLHLLRKQKAYALDNELVKIKLANTTSDCDFYSFYNAPEEVKVSRIQIFEDLRLLGMRFAKSFQVWKVVKKN